MTMLTGYGPLRKARALSWACWLTCLLTACTGPADRQPEVERKRSFMMSEGTMEVSLQDARLRWWGRMDRHVPDTVRMAWTGCQLVLACEADTLCLKLHSEPGELAPDGQPWPVYLTVLIDSLPPQVHAIRPDTRLLRLPLGPGAHQVRVFKRSEALTGTLVLHGLALRPAGQLLDLPPRPARHLEVIGNSITAGYGNLGQDRDCDFSAASQDGYQAYGALAAQALGWAYTSVCYSGRGILVNYDGSRRGTLLELYQQVLADPTGPTYDFTGPAPDVVAINLGTNDFAGRTPAQAAFVRQYLALCRLIRQHYPQARLLLLSSPMLTGRALALQRQYLDAAADTLRAEGETRIHRLDLTPQGPLGYGCDWHPNLAQHQRNARELADYLRRRVD